MRGLEQFGILAHEEAPVLDLSREVLWPLGVAMVVGVLSGFLVLRIATVSELYDKPDAGLKPHEKPVPFLGGVSIYCGWLAAIVVTVVLQPVGRFELVWVVIGGTVLMLTGLLDDIRHLSPFLRLFMQAAVTGFLLFAGVGRGVSVALLEPCRGILPEFVFGEVAGIVLSAVFCAAVLAGATNATNLIDGLDGLCAGVLGIASLGFLVAYITLGGTFLFGEAHDILIIVLPVGVLGACLAFLRFNFNPASMFMGDSGSLLLGFNVAAFIILFAEHASWRGLLVGLTLFGFPIYDTALALGRRWLNKKPLFVGDRSHFYDQIRDRGLTVRQTVLACHGLALAFAALGVVMIHLPGAQLVGTFVALPIVGVLTSWRFGMLRVDDAADRSNRPSNDA